MDGTLILLVGGSLLVGGGACLMLLDPLHHALVSSLARGESQLPYALMIVAHVGAASAAVALPLGALLGLAFGAGGRRDISLTLLGASAALALTPILAEEWLGRRDLLSAALVLSAATGISLLRRAPWTCSAARLPRGHAACLVLLGAMAALGDQLSRVHIDLGSNDVAWLASAMCLAAVVGSSLSGMLKTHVMDGLVPLAAAWALTSPAEARMLPTLGLELSLTRLAWFAVPLGLWMGALLGQRGKGVPMSLVPALMLLATPLVGWLALPRLGATWTFAALGIGLLIVALVSRVRPMRAALSVVLALGVCWVPYPAGTHDVRLALLENIPRETLAWPVELREFMADGEAGWLRDPVDGRNRISIDGVASLARHPLQEHRLVHVPLVLQGNPAHVLVVATDSGESEGAALEHGPEQLDWLRPLSIPGVRALTPEPPGRRRPLGSERMFLASQRHALELGEFSPYEVVALMPDPRVRRRMGLTSTVEFYAAVQAVLTADGMMCQWWDPAFVHPDDFRAALASANAVFASTTLVLDHPQSRRPLIGILGARREITVRPQVIGELIGSSRHLKREMERVGLDPLLVACLIGPAPGVVDLMAPHALALRDERATLGARGGRRRLANPETLLATSELFTENRANPMQWTRVPEHLEGIAVAQSRAIHESWSTLFQAAKFSLVRQGFLAQPFESLTLGAQTESDEDFLLEAFRSAPDWPYLEGLVLKRMERLLTDDRPEEAEAWLREALERDFRSTRLRVALAEMMESSGDRPEAISLYHAVLALIPGHEGAERELARLEADS